MHDIWSYIAVMSAVTIAIRLTPALLLRREIKNVFVRSFLYYVPYVTLAVMTFAFSLYLAWNGASLFRVAAGASATVFLVELLFFA